MVLSRFGVIGVIGPSKHMISLPLADLSNYFSTDMTADPFTKEKHEAMAAACDNDGRMMEMMKIIYLFGSEIL